MKFAKALALFSLLLTPALAQAAGDRPPPPEMSPRIPQFSLDTTVLEFPSGLRVLLQEDHSHPIVTVYKYVGHGFNDDPAGAEETAHFVEHVWFRSLHGGMPPIMFVIQDLGTMFNATTAADRTDYRTTANVKYLPIMLKLESLRMTDFYRGVTEEQIEVEREVIRNEWRRRNEQSTALLLDYMNEVVYPADHPYAKRSTHESLNNITLPVIQKYVDDYYTPESTTITIVGDFDTQEIISMLLENFDLSLLHPKLTAEFTSDEANAEYMAKLLDYRPRPGLNVPDAEADPEGFEAFKNDPGNWRLFLRNPDNPDDPADVSWFLHDASKPLASRLGKRAEPPPVGTKEPVTRKGPVDKTTVLVGWSLPAGYHDDHFNLVVLGNMATGYVQDGLATNFGKDVVAREASCFAQPQMHATTMLCGVEINNKRLDPVNVAEKIMDQMRNITIPEDQFQQQIFFGQFSRAKQEQFRNLLTSMDLVAAVFGSRAEYIGEYAHWTGNPNYYSTAMKQVANLEGQAITQLAYDYLRRDRAGVLIVEPLATKEIDTASNDSSYGGASEGDAVIEASDDLDKASTEAIAESYAKPRLDGIVDMKMENGIRVVVLSHGKAPKLHARLIFGGGSAVEPLGIHGFAARFSQSEGYDPLRYAGTPSYYFSPPFLGFGESVAKPISPFAGERGFAFGITAPSGNLDSALWTLRAELETLAPYPSGARSWVKRQYSSLKRNFFESSWHQRRMSREHLFPGEPRYQPTSWEEIEAMESWGAPEIKGYLDDHLHPENATLLIVGNISKDEALATALQQFGGWQAPGDSAKLSAPSLGTPAKPVAESRTVIFDDDKRTQTQTTMACRLNVKGEEDADAVQLLGNMMSNQILANLRVKEGLAYSPGGGAFLQDDGSGMLFFTSLAVNRGVGRTVEFFKYVVEKVEKGEIDPKEIKLHQLRINRGGGVGNQSVEQMAGMLSAAILDQRDWTELEARGDRVAAVTAEDLSRIVEGCLDHAYVSLEGPQDVITPQLDEKGYAYEIYDYEKAGEDLLWKYDKKAAKKRQKSKEKADKKKEAEGSDEEEAEAEAEDSSADAEQLLEHHSR